MTSSNNEQHQMPKVLHIMHYINLRLTYLLTYLSNSRCKLFYSTGHGLGELSYIRQVGNELWILATFTTY